MNTVSYKQNKRRQNNDEDITINLGDDYMSKENSKLLDAHRNIDELLSNGGNILGSLRDQRTVLTGVRKKIADINNYLGLSSSILNLIEKRIFSDKILLFGGMIVFMLIIVLFMIYFW